MKILIKNVNILTMNENYDIIENGQMLIENDTIIEITDECHQKADLTIDGRSGILMPGMINGHSHLGMIPFRGLGDDCHDRLRRLLFPLEKECMTKDLVYHSSRYAIAEMLLSGITTFVDMYYFEDEVAKAAHEMRMRGFVGETIVDFPSPDSPSPYGGLDYCRWFIPKWKKHPLIVPFVAPHATNTCDLEHLKQAHQLAKENDVLMALHVSELDYEMDYFKNEYQMTPVAYLNEHGLMDDHLLAAHCIHLNQEDIKLFKENKSTIAHCLVANLKAAKGVMPLKEILDNDIPILLGTDGPSSGNTLELFTTLRMMACVHKTYNHDRSLFSARDLVALATIKGAKALKKDHLIGSLEVGKKADFIILETQSANMYPLNDLYSTIVYSANPGNVDMVFVNGYCLVYRKRLQLTSLEALRENLEKATAAFNQTAKEYADQKNI